jgi:hypothetical protein
MNPYQSNTQDGLVNMLADVNLLAAINAGTDVRGYLVKNTAGGKVEIPAAVTDIVLYTVEDVTSVGAGYVTVRPLDQRRNVRIRTTGVTGSAGDQIGHDTANYGRGKAVTVAGNWVVGIAEENYVAGQNVLVRPLCIFHA